MTVLLPSRPRPEAGELFSSWAVRLAWANGQPLRRWLRAVCPTGWHFERDLDWGAQDVLLDAVSTATGLSRQQVDATTLDSYRGRLFPARTRLVPGRWLIYAHRVGPDNHPRGGPNRLVEAHALQCCPDCLATGEPYYRLVWRLAYATVCTVHGRLLIDRCPACERPLNFRRSPPAVQGLDVPVEQMARCASCGFDWRELSLSAYDPTEVLTESGAHRVEGRWGWTHPELTKQIHGVGIFQRRIDRALETGVYSLAGEPVPVQEFMSGLAHLAHLLTGPTVTRAWRAAVYEHSGRQPLPQVENGQARFGRLRVDARFATMGLLNWLTTNWPVRFHRCCVSARMSRSLLFDPAEPVGWLLREADRYDGFVRRPHLKSAQIWDRKKFPKRTLRK